MNFFVNLVAQTTLYTFETGDDGGGGCSAVANSSQSPQLVIGLWEEAGKNPNGLRENTQTHNA